MIQESQRPAADALDRLAQTLEHRNAAPRGLYLWGPPGRGKTWLMDRFVARSPVPSRRVHLHRFLAGLHADAHRLGSIHRALDATLADIRLLCFDEFHVHDPGDAILVTRMLETLLRSGTTLVATSNYPPEGLLPNPLFHHLVEPAIALLETHLDVVGVRGADDLRPTLGADRRRGFATGSYRLVEPESSPGTPESTFVPVGHRRLRVLDAAAGVIRVSFADLCEAPTSTADYFVLLADYTRWVIVGVPALRNVSADAVRRFGNVVDVLCDADVPLDIESDTPRDDLVDDTGGRPDVDRLVSRLSMLREVTSRAQPTIR